MTEPISITRTTDKSVWHEILAEIGRQKTTHPDDHIGHRDVGYPTRLLILTEEIGEAAAYALEYADRGATEQGLLRDELVQVAACAVAWSRTSWDKILDVQTRQRKLWAGLWPGSPGIAPGLRLAHLGDHHGRVCTAVVNADLAPDVWSQVITEALIDVAATACAWITAIDTEAGPDTCHCGQHRTGTITSRGAVHLADGCTGPRR